MVLSSYESSWALSWEPVKSYLETFDPFLLLQFDRWVWISAQYQLIILHNWAEVFLTVLPTTLWILSFSSLIGGKRHNFLCVSFRQYSLVFSEAFSPNFG